MAHWSLPHSDHNNNCTQNETASCFLPLISQTLIHFWFTKPTYTYLMYVILQFLVYCYMFRRNSSIYTPIHKTHCSTLQYITVHYNSTLQYIITVISVMLQLVPYIGVQTASSWQSSAETCSSRRQSVPKRRHIKFRRRGITQKGKCNIRYTAKVWYQR